MLLRRLIAIVTVLALTVLLLAVVPFGQVVWVPFSNDSSDEAVIAQHKSQPVLGREWPGLQRVSDETLAVENYAALIYRIYNERPALREQLSEAERVCILRDWIYETIPAAATSDTMIDIYDPEISNADPGIFLLNVLNKTEQGDQGFFASGMAYSLACLYRLFGYSAFSIDYAAVNSADSLTSHVSVLVDIGADEAVWILQDPTFNLTYCDINLEPLEYSQLLLYLGQHRDAEILVQYGSTGEKMVVSSTQDNLPADVEQWESGGAYAAMIRQDYGTFADSVLQQLGHKFDRKGYPHSALYLFRYPMAVYNVDPQSEQMATLQGMLINGYLGEMAGDIEVGLYNAIPAIKDREWSGLERVADDTLSNPDYIELIYRIYADRPQLMQDLSDFERTSLIRDWVYGNIATASNSTYMTDIADPQIYDIDPRQFALNAFDMSMLGEGGFFCGGLSYFFACSYSLLGYEAFTVDYAVYDETGIVISSHVHAIVNIGNQTDLWVVQDPTFNLTYCDAFDEPMGYDFFLNNIRTGNSDQIQVVFGETDLRPCLAAGTSLDAANAGDSQVVFIPNHYSEYIENDLQLTGEVFLKDGYEEDFLSLFLYPYGLFTVDSLNEELAAKQIQLRQYIFDDDAQFTNDL